MAKPALVPLPAALESLPLWTAANGREAIVRNLRFLDFASAFGFMAQIALVAEKMDHHPEWSNVYNRIDILLQTHEVCGVTQRDIVLAQAIDAAAQKAGAA